MALVLTKEVVLRAATGDPALYYSGKEAVSPVDGLIVTQVDDVLGAGSAEFPQRTLQLGSTFDDKPRESPPLSLSGVRISPLSGP